MIRRLNFPLFLAMAFVPVLAGCQISKSAAADSTLNERVQRAGIWSQRSDATIVTRL